MIYIIYNIYSICTCKYTAWCADYWQGECPTQNGGGGSQRSQIRLLCHPENTKTAQKRPVSRTY